MPGLARALGYLAAGVLLVLLAGKMLRLPVALMIVYGTSMEPTFEPLDLVLGVEPWLAGGVEKGDVVVWCLPGDFWRSSCVVHRVVDLVNTSRGVLVVTKGDALDVSDPPVPMERVAYVVVYRAPRRLVLPLLAAAAAAAAGYYYLYLPYVTHRRYALEPGAPALLMVLAYALFNIAYVGSGMLDASPVIIDLPRVYGEHLSFNLSAGLLTVKLSYNTSLHPSGLPSCSLVGGFNASPVVEGFSAQPGEAVMAIRIPQEAFMELWLLDTRRVSRTALPPPPAKVATGLMLRCSLDFDKGVLEDTYPVAFSWSEPVVEASGKTLVLGNHNPVPIPVEVVVYAPSPGGGYRLVHRERLVLDPFTVERLDLSKLPGSLRAYVRYTFLGHFRSVGVTLHG